MDKEKQQKVLETYFANIEKTTGKPVAHWAELVRKSGLEKHGEQLKLLKEKHGLSHGYANLIVQHAKGNVGVKSAAEEKDLLSTQFEGKENLRPLYDQLAKIINGFGKDVEFAPKKAYVSVKRKKQFAIIQPSTKTRLDLGLNLKAVEPQGKLESAGSWNSMCTHRIRLEDSKQIDQSVKAALKKAYEQAG